MNKEELLYNEIYERTKDFGRTQFVRELMRLQRENKELQQKVNQLETTISEVRKECETNIRIFDSGKSYSIAVKDTSKDILKILDKVGGSNE